MQPAARIMPGRPRTCGCAPALPIIAVPRCTRPALGAAVATILSACAAFAGAHANPWLAPGDVALRHDIHLLADAGVIRSPIMTWPISWPDLARDLFEADADEPRAPDIEDALRRVRRAARDAARTGLSRARLQVAGSHEPIRLRTFSDAPREEGELGIGASWLGHRAAANLQVALVSDPADEETLRFDGSYLGVAFANVMISAGAMERWWGPGWEGSLILSTNARPLPGISIERNHSDPFRSKFLRWLGPWRASFSLGEAEGSDVAVPNTRFFAARVSFRPALGFELGLSRTAQWCGEARPCDLETFGNLLIGRDNRDASLSLEEEPGNQMAGYDVRLRSPWRALPLVLYAQAIGEDEAGGLPSRFIGLAGVELWGSSGRSSYRVHAEYADTAANFLAGRLADYAYRNALYPQGYAYRGRTIGHTLDNDGLMYSLGVMLVRPSGEAFSLLARRVELNRLGPAPDPVHTASASADELENVEVQYNRTFAWGELQVGAGHDSYNGPAREGSKTRGFIRWRQGF
jgi:hypothetical protein